MKEAKKDSWNPKQYEKFKSERSQPFFDLMGLLEKSEGPKIVDLGCGTGELTKILHEKLKATSTIGIDNSDQMLEAAGAFTSSDLDFTSGDIQHFNQPKAYDIVFSNAALQWCLDHKILLSKIAGSLRDLGQLAIQMPMNHDYPTHTVARQVAQRDSFIKFLNKEEIDFKDSNMLRPEDYAGLLFDLGFKRQNVFLKVYGHILDSRESVVEWVKGTTLTYYQSRLPVDVYEDFLSQYKTELFRVLSPQRPFFFPFKRIFIWGSFKS